MKDNWFKIKFFALVSLNLKSDLETTFNISHEPLYSFMKNIIL